MGCDIHLYVEKRVNRETVALTQEGLSVVPSKDGESGEWVSVDTLTPHSERAHMLEHYLTPGGQFYNPDPQRLKEAQEEYDSYPEFEVAYGDHYYSGRNYGLFSILADVRSGANADPIDEARGLPDDVSDLIQRESDNWGVDGHSHSYFSLAELLEVDWFGRTHEYTGVLDAGTFEKLDKHGLTPDSWSGGVGGANVVHLSNTEMRDKIAKGEILGWYNRDAWKTAHPGQEEPARNHGIFGSSTVEPDGNSYYTEATWQEPWSKVVGTFMDTIVRLARLAQTEGVRNEDVRIVFWFDN